MDKNEFKKLLFKVAFCTMACDGHVDAREIDEMKLMDKNTLFFHDIDLSAELDELIQELGVKGVALVSELFNELEKNELNPIQELLVLEVALRIINADEVHDENEVKFIHFLRAHLKVHDEIIVDRFGELEILHTNPYLSGAKLNSDVTSFSDELEMPTLEDFNSVDLTN